MKKILIVSLAMEIGGAEKALLGLLQSIDYTKYDVDLFLCRQVGELLSQIPSEVNLLPMNQARYLAVPMTSLVREKQFKMLYGRLKAKYLSKKAIKRLKLKTENTVSVTYSHLYTYKYIDDINPDIKYDLAISFLIPHYICLNKCNAKKKIAWIHTDYSKVDVDYDTEFMMWELFDQIVSISDDCTKSFISIFPTLENKIIRMDNIITNQMVCQQADLFNVINEMDDQIIRLLSIGRFCTQKNFDSIPEICRLILKKGLNVKWYIIGFGGDEELIKSKIKEYHMENRVIMLGKKDNPYPYIKACDYYIQPSRYEGKAVAVREAQILGKPVIITDYPTSSSQLTDGYDGVIVPMDNEGCAKGIVDFINDQDKVKEIVDHLKNETYSNESEVNKIYELIGD